MSNVARLQVLNVDNCLLVDSREIATELGIDHGNFLETVRKYKDTIEEAFVQIQFKTASVINKVGAINNTTYALLTEDQATFLMTLSRNTPQVVRAKVNLVKAFSEAKRLLLETHHADQVARLDWRRERLNLKEVHIVFQNACISSGFPASTAHDMITKKVSRLTAKDARKLPLVEGDQTIGLNHQSCPTKLSRIAEVKLAFGSLVRHKNECLASMVRRAYKKAFPPKAQG